VIAQTHYWNFRLAYQVLVLGVLLGLGWSCKWMSQSLLGLVGAMISPGLVMPVGISLYVVSSLALLLLLFPRMTGLRREHFRTVFGAMARGESRVLA
jgi:hypothetical protein